MFMYNPYTDPRSPFARARAERKRAERAEREAREAAERAEAQLAGAQAGSLFSWRETAYDFRQLILAARAAPGPVRIKTVGTTVPPFGAGPASFKGAEGSSVCLGASGAEVAEGEVWVVVDDDDRPEHPVVILVGSPGAVRFAIEGGNLEWRRWGYGPLQPRYLARARRALGLG